MKEGGRNKYGYYFNKLKNGRRSVEIWTHLHSKRQIFWLIFNAEFKFTGFRS